MLRSALNPCNYVFVCIFLFAACATVMSPTGGNKDIDPPQLLQRTPGDSLLQVKKGKWTFVFNEFIKLQDVQKEVRVTPMLKNNPKITSNKSRLYVEIPDSVLVANTTYRIDFGNAVRDMHEGNPIKNLQLTFSTGAYFDSLSLSGNCFMAINGMPDTAVSILLYPAETPDSMLFKTKPMYVEKNTSAGFQFQHLPNKLFKAVALQDPNNNYVRDALSDRIAFLQKIVDPLNDTARIRFLSFSEVDEINKGELGKKDNTRGKMKMVEPFNFKVFLDTAQNNQRTFSIYDSVKIVFTRKPTVVQIKAVRLYSDSALEAEIQWKEGVDEFTYYLKHQWQENKVYRLVFLNDFTADTNQVFLAERSYTFRTKHASDYGLIRVMGIADTTQILQLVLNDSVVATRVLRDTLTLFDHLLPGQYVLRRHYDSNGNAIWDRGSWPEKRQPEKVELLFDRISIKGNWENALDIRPKN